MLLIQNFVQIHVWGPCLVPQKIAWIGARQMVSSVTPNSVSVRPSRFVLITPPIEREVAIMRMHAVGGKAGAASCGQGRLPSALP